MSVRTIIATCASVLALAGCSGDPGRRYSKSEAQTALKKFETPGVVIGEFTLARSAVIDGDTIKVKGLESTLRLLAIDTEETFKNDADRRGAAADFEQYLRDKRGDGARPVKAATPLGEEAKKYAKQFFADVKRVRLERDHPKEIRGRYNRYLAYVLVEKDGKWLNYNVECVRAGMSPYFTKYGYSRRFHDDFVQAEKEARAAGVGIWDPTKEHYRDYEERIAWWKGRAEFIKDFEIDAKDKDNYITLTNWDALRRLEEHLDKEVVLLGSVGEIKLGDKGPTRVRLSRRMFNDFSIIFFDKDVFGTSRIAENKGEFVRIRGFVTLYKNKFTKKNELQIVVQTPGQVTGSVTSDDNDAG